MTIYGYARVSTEDQSLDMQLDAFKKYGVDEVFEEKVSGAKKDRPQLARMLAKLQEKDVVVVYKLDRISRSTKHLIELSELFDKKGVKFVSIRDAIDTTTSMGKFFFTIMAGVAQLERDIISDRTKAGLEAARARGRVGGRKAVSQDKIDHALALYDAKKLTVPEITTKTGVSKTTLYKYVRGRKS